VCVCVCVCVCVLSKETDQKKMYCGLDFFFPLLEIISRTSRMLGKCYTTEPRPLLLDLFVLFLGRKAVLGFELRALLTLCPGQPGP
jgi:hypothetical protein